MDEVILLYERYLEKLLNDHKSFLISLPNWKLNSYLPEELQSQSLEIKIDYLTGKMKQGFLFKMINDDVKLIKRKNILEGNLIEELKSLNIDDRDLEAKGFKEDRKNDFYALTQSVREILNMKST